MIRKADAKDIDRMTDIWLEASYSAHHFIPRSYWDSKSNDMKNRYLPSSDNFVYQDDLSGTIYGFISLTGDYIAAIFIDTTMQRKGIGRQLIEYVKANHNHLRLSVFAENNSATNFYLQQDFIITEVRRDEYTGHIEYVMEYDAR